MRTARTRCGEVSDRPEDVILFPHGLLGFESLREFLILPGKRQDPLICLQSLENPEVAFLMVDPARYFPDYSVSVGEQEVFALQLQEDEQHCVLSMITMHSDKSITLNLVAPVIYAPRTQRAVQMVLENTQYSVRTPLP